MKRSEEDEEHDVNTKLTEAASATTATFKRFFFIKGLNLS
jgi:hypothetical protein